MLLINQAFGQNPKFKLGKNWALIEGKHTVLIDSNRVNYIVAPQYPNGMRVNNFNQMEPFYKHDSEFIHAQIPANKVYDLNKNIEGQNFFISKTEVSNKEYNEFVVNCIKQWMQTNQKDIASKYKWNSPEYIAAIQNWLSVNNDSTPILFNDNIKPAKNWLELQQRNLNWSKIKFKGISIYPNTQCWNTDFPKMNNNPMCSYYFGHPAYQNFPVVGVSQKQALLYCRWLNENQNDDLTIDNTTLQFGLPKEQDWEAAASVMAKNPSKKSSGSPVLNNYLRNASGCYIANVLPNNNQYSSDGAFFTTTVESYLPNDAGCYNMQGNVAEWTTTELDFRTGEATDEGFIIKGGAWNLPEAASTIGSRTVLKENESASYVGFRVAAYRMQKYRRHITPEF
jgi:formylglycine-generating enzyme required for sulfatase activity